MATGKKVLRVATIAAGILLLILSIIRFTKIVTLNFSQVLLSIYMV